MHNFITLGFDLRMNVISEYLHSTLNAFNLGVINIQNIISADPSVLPRTDGVDLLMSNLEWAGRNVLGLGRNVKEVLDLKHATSVKQDDQIVLAFRSDPSSIKRLNAKWHVPNVELVEIGSDLYNEQSFCGYDVIELDGLCSAIFGCGLEWIQSSDQNTRAHFYKLNKFGLFADLSDALSFARHRSAEISEHAPFEALEIAKLSI